MEVVKSNPKRPSAALLAKRVIRTKAFGPLKSQLLLVREELEATKDEARIKELKEQERVLIDEGRIEYSVSGKVLENPGAIEGMQSASIAQDLYDRYVSNQESFDGIDPAGITRVHCQQAAQIAVAITEIDGGELYSPDEILFMPYYPALEELFIAFIGLAQQSFSGELKSRTSTG